MNKYLVLLLTYVNVRGLVVEGILQGVVKPALDKMAKDSSNPYDDLAVAALYPPLEKAVGEAVDDILEKITKPEAKVAAPAPKATTPAKPV